MSIYLFNPDNDHSLASFLSNYTPPKVAVRLASDLEMLPLWYAEANSLIIAEKEESCLYLDKMSRLFNITSKLIPLREVQNFPGHNISPWGWSPMLKSKLLRAGVREDMLPADKTIEQLRNYSNRQHAVKMLAELKQEREAFCGDSHYFTSIEELLIYLDSFLGNKVVKMPLSGSGRGVKWVIDKITDKQIDWCKRSIREQGGLVAEPYLDKVQDFAMEFSINQGIVSFEGYSLFDTASTGAYTGNLLMEDRSVEEQLSKYVSVELLHHLKKSLLRLLPIYFPGYNGYLGVDMMICREGDNYVVQPCVEINMRMNMGIVAHGFYQQYVKQGAKGVYKVEFFKKEGTALQTHQKMQHEFPLVIEDKRIASGYLALNPVTASTGYIAYAVIDESII